MAALAGLAGGAVLSRVLVQEDYGVWRQTRLVYETVAPLLMLGLPKALLYFMPREPERARGVLTEHLLTLTLGGALFAVLIALGGNHLLAWAFDTPILSLTLLILIPYGLFMFPISALQACLIARDQVQWSALFPVISQVVSLGLVIAAGVIWATPVAVITALVVGAALTAGPGLWLMWRSTAGTQSTFALSNGLDHLRYAVPLGLASMIGMLSRKLDQIIVSSSASTEAYAIYANGAMELPLIGAITGSITAILLPDMARMYRDGQRGEIVALWQRAMGKSMLILAPTMVFVLLMAPEIMRVLFSSAYEGSAEPFRVYALLLPGRAAVYGAVLMAAGRTRTITVLTAILLGMNALLSVVLVHWLGPVGAAWATVISTYLIIGGFIWVIGGLMETPTAKVVAWGDVGFTVLLAALALAPSWGLSQLGFWSELGDFWRLSIAGGVFGLVLLVAYQVTGRVSVGQLVGIVKRRLGR